MGTLILLQVAFDLALIAGLTVLFIDRSRAKNEDNPRLSRGLQLLSSKIAILQDLMDRSETTGKHLSQLLEVKKQDVQETLEEVERHIHRVGESIEKSKDVARLFRDKIPHEEIIERQTTAKYIKAAKLAHQGLSAQEIAGQVDIPQGELELIVKLNRQNLMVNSEPAWLEEDDVKETSGAIFVTEEEVKQATAPQPAASTPASEPRFAGAGLVGAFNEPPLFQTTPLPPPGPGTQTPAKKTLIYSSRRIGGVEQESPSIRPVIFKKIAAENKIP